MYSPTSAGPAWPGNCFVEDSMRKYDIVLKLTVALALAAILLPLAAVFLISAAVLLIPAVPLIAVGVLTAQLVLAARSKQSWAAHRCLLPRARALASGGGVRESRWTDDVARFFRPVRSARAHRSVLMRDICLDPIRVPSQP